MQTNTPALYKDSVLCSTYKERGKPSDSSDLSLLLGSAELKIDHLELSQIKALEKVINTPNPKNGPCIIDVDQATCDSRSLISKFILRKTGKTIIKDRRDLIIHKSEFVSNLPGFDQDITKRVIITSEDDNFTDNSEINKFESALIDSKVFSRLSSPEKDVAFALDCATSTTPELSINSRVKPDLTQSGFPLFGLKSESAISEGTVVPSVNSGESLNSRFLKRLDAFSSSNSSILDLLFSDLPLKRQTNELEEIYSNIKVVDSSTIQKFSQFIIEKKYDLGHILFVLKAITGSNDPDMFKRRLIHLKIEKMDYTSQRSRTAFESLIKSELLDEFLRLPLEKWREFPSYVLIHTKPELLVSSYIANFAAISISYSENMSISHPEVRMYPSEEANDSSVREHDPWTPLDTQSSLTEKTSTFDLVLRSTLFIYNFKIMILELLIEKFHMCYIGNVQTLHEQNFIRWRSNRFRSAISLR